MTVDYSGLLEQVRDLQRELAAIREYVNLLRRASQSPDTDKDADATTKPKRRGRPPKAAKPDADATTKPKRRGRPPKAAKPAGMPPRPQGRGRLRKKPPKKLT